MPMKKNGFSRVLALLLTSGLLMACLPLGVLATEEASGPEEERLVRVIVENTAFPESEGAAWEGTLLDEWIELQDEDSMMSCIQRAIEDAGYSIVGAESNYISSIEGLSEFDGGFGSGWIGTLGGWLTNRGFAAFTVENGDLCPGDVIRISYTRGGIAEGAGEKALAELSADKGELTPAFHPDERDYTLTLPAGTDSVVLTPVAVDAQYQMWSFVGEESYRLSEAIPVREGTVIEIRIGDPAWPSMSRDDSPAEVYTLTVAFEEEETGEEEIKEEKPEEEKQEEKEDEEEEEVSPTEEPKRVCLTALRIARTSAFDEENSYLAMEEDGFDLPRFQPETTDYDLGTVNDSVGGLYFRAESPAGEKVYLEYGSVSRNISLNGAAFKSVRFLHSGENRFSIRVEGEGGTVYSFLLRSVPTLTALSAQWDGGALYLDRDFDPLSADYTLTVPNSAESITVSATPRSEDCTVTLNGLADDRVDVTDCDGVEVCVSSPDGACSRTYTLHIERQAESLFRVIPTPADALVRVTDKNGEALEADEEGFFHGVFSGNDFRYTVSRSGYVTQKGSVPAEGGELAVTLEKVEEVETDLTAEWRNFRNSDDNMAITDIALPSASQADSVSLKWKRKLGEGWDAAPSVQIIVDNAVIVMSGTNIYKLDPETGETLLSGELVDAPNWGYTPPSYAGGMILCPLNGGVIQAVDAKTLASRWVYRDPLGGQSLSPITVSEGYAYTGFWNGESRDANYVCLNITDEDPTRPDEEKESVWTLRHKGGFYWAGSVIVGDGVIFGGEDGVSGGGDSTLYAVNRLTGKVISAVALPGMGDQRASVALADGRVWFTVQEGWFCSLAVDEETGALSDLRSSRFEGQSTSTPILYKGRAYYGVGSGISAAGSSGAMVVADAETMAELYRVPLRGYPQGSLLLSTAREEQGELCFYATYNDLPGGISMITIDPEDATGAKATVTELFEAEGCEEYCISSLICDEGGTLYYKNDSGNVFAVGIPFAENVTALIADIDSEITADSGVGITAARNAYDALSDREKEKVTNLSVLLEAEAEYAVIAKRIADAEGIIEAIGTVDGTEAARLRVEEARRVYDALSDCEKKHVGNANALESAERQQEKVEHARAVELLIDRIGTVKNTAESEKHITDARAAFDALLGTEKALVSNYGTLTAAEKQLQKLKTGGTSGTTYTLSSTGGSTKTAVTIGGVSYRVDKAAAELMKEIERLTAPGKEPTEAELVSAYKTYEAMSEELKTQIFNFDELQPRLYALTALHQSGASTEELPWSVELRLTRLTDSRMRDMAGALEQSGHRLLSLYELTMTDILTGKPYIPPKAVRLRMDAPAGLSDETLLMAWTDENERLQYLDVTRDGGSLLWNAPESSLYALTYSQVAAVAELPEEITEPEEKTEEKKPFPVGLAVTAGLSAAALGTAVVLKRKKEE